MNGMCLINIGSLMVLNVLLGFYIIKLRNRVSILEEEAKAD